MDDIGNMGRHQFRTTPLLKMMSFINQQFPHLRTHPQITNFLYLSRPINFRTLPLFMNLSPLKFSTLRLNLSNSLDTCKVN